MADRFKSVFRHDAIEKEHCLRAVFFYRQSTINRNRYPNMITRFEKANLGLLLNLVHISLQSLHNGAKLFFPSSRRRVLFLRYVGGIKLHFECENGVFIMLILKEFYLMPNLE
ncbi:hypothetical protein VIBRN418_11110 [Vibrio sp. N418]|nr:hypothetical protein VIBRN418_11110 [Vibrio sp. N418]